MQVHRLNTAAIKHGGGDEVLALNFIEVMEGRGVVGGPPVRRNRKRPDVSEGAGIGADRRVC